MKPSFQVNIIFEKSEHKDIKLKLVELKNRVKFILSLISDFSTEVSIKFCSAEEMTQTNSQFRKKNYATDVLSFPPSSPQMQDKYNYLGDILICLPVCLAQSKKAKVTMSKELEKMILHGLVHLKGFDHERGTSAWKVMNSLETILQKELINILKTPTWCSVVI